MSKKRYRKYNDYNRNDDNNRFDKTSRLEITKEEINEPIVAKENENVEENTVVKKQKIKRYLSYNQRILIHFGLLILMVLGGIFFIYKSIKFRETQKIEYVEKGNVHYKVKLKKNKFYDDTVMEENMSYVSSLIDDIDISFNYNVVLTGLIDFNVNYDVVAKLIISDSNNSTSFYEKEYVLVDKKEDSREELGHYTINENVSVKYDQFNDIATSFKSKYKVNTNSFLEVYLRINKNSNTINFDKTQNTLLVRIPLSQKSINIKLDSSGWTYSGSDITGIDNLKIKMPLFLLIGVFLIIMGLYNGLKGTMLFYKFYNNVNPYDKYLNKILKEYDRFIANVKVVPDLDKYNKTILNSFEELLDIRDNVNKPIMYFEIVKHQKSQFYVIDGNDIYVFIMKAVDLENK